MNTPELVLLSLALGTDLFSLSIPLGCKPLRRRLIVEAGLVFALFHIIFILLGYGLGVSTGQFIELWSDDALEKVWLIGDWARGFGALVLIGLGLRMVTESLQTQKIVPDKPLQGLALLVLAVSVSVDAMAAGLGLGMLEVPWIKLCVILGTIIFLISFIGLSLGRWFGRRWGLWAERGGGLALVAFGAHILIQAVL